MSALLLFAKFPAPGKAKTRLIPKLGAQNAALLSEAFLLDLLERYTTDDLGEHTYRVLCYAPVESGADFVWLLAKAKLNDRGWILHPQPDGDLGARMKEALAWSKQQHMGATAFIGSDAPDLPSGNVRGALACARADRCTIQRARDGGYVMLALPQGIADEVFDGVRWSDKHTAADQIRRIHELGKKVMHIHPVWMDVDEPGDLISLYERLKRLRVNKPGYCERTWRLLREWLVEVEPGAKQPKAPR